MVYTLICLSPFILLALPFIAGAYIDFVVKPRERRAKQAERDMKQAIAAERQAALAEARLHRAMIAEAKIAEAHNKTMREELNIELLALKIQKERKAQGLDAPDFDPKDYE